MRIYRFLFILGYISTLLGCSLGRDLTSVAFVPVGIVTSFVDGAAGTNMTENLYQGIDETFKHGSKLDANAIKKNMPNHTLLEDYRHPVFIENNGTAILKEAERLRQVKWTISADKLCIEKGCSEIRVKNGELFMRNKGDIKKGDSENLVSLFAQQQRDDAMRQAELERKKAEEKAAQERAEVERKRAEEEQKRFDAMYDNAYKLAEALKCEEALKLDRDVQSQDGKNHSESDKTNGYRIDFSNCQKERSFKAMLKGNNPQSMYLMAGKYERDGSSSKARELYDAIISRFAGSIWAIKANDQLNAAQRASDAAEQVRHAENTARELERERQKNNERAEARAKSACRSRIDSCTSSCTRYGTYSHERRSCENSCRSICTAY